MERALFLYGDDNDDDGVNDDDDDGDGGIHEFVEMKGREGKGHSNKVKTKRLGATALRRMLMSVGQWEMMGLFVKGVIRCEQRLMHHALTRPDHRTEQSGDSANSLRCLGLKVVVLYMSRATSAPGPSN